MESVCHVSRSKTGVAGTGKRDYRNPWPCVAVCEHRWFPFQNYRKAGMRRRKVSFRLIPSACRWQHGGPDALSIERALFI